VLIGTVVKYDIVVAPLLYAATWIRRDDMVRPILEAGAVMVLGLVLLIVLNYLYPGGHSDRPILATSLRNAAFLVKQHITYLPTLTFGPLVTLAIYGWRDGDRFSRAATLLALLMAAILFVLTNFEEVRAQFMIFLLFGSIRARHAEHMLADVGEDEVRRDRRDLVEAGLAELALDVVFRGEAEAAMGLQAGVGRLP
jgi:hypothetical protein